MAATQGVGPLGPTLGCHCSRALALKKAILQFKFIAHRPLRLGVMRTPVGETMRSLSRSAAAPGRPLTATAYASLPNTCSGRGVSSAGAFDLFSSSPRPSSRTRSRLLRAMNLLLPSPLRSGGLQPGAPRQGTVSTAPQSRNIDRLQPLRVSLSSFRRWGLQSPRKQSLDPGFSP
jgi:hypothetical protein